MNDITNIILAERANKINVDPTANPGANQQYRQTAYPNPNAYYPGSGTLSLPYNGSHFVMGGYMSQAIQSIGTVEFNYSPAVANQIISLNVTVIGGLYIPMIQSPSKSTCVISVYLYSGALATSGTIQYYWSGVFA